MTKETMRVLIETPDLLNRLSIAEFREMTPRATKDLPEPKLIVSELGTFGVSLAVIFPVDDYLELRSGYERLRQAIDQIETCFVVQVDGSTEGAK